MCVFEANIQKYQLEKKKTFHNNSGGSLSIPFFFRVVFGGRFFSCCFAFFRLHPNEQNSTDHDSRSNETTETQRAEQHIEFNERSSFARSPKHSMV